MVSNEHRTLYLRSEIENQNKQIISLGAGYDTLYFNLKAAGKYDFERIKYIEMDLPGVVKRKVRLPYNIENQLIDNR